MTGNDNRYFIVSNRPSDSLCRHRGNPPLCGKLLCDFTICYRLSVWNLQQYLPYSLSEVCSRRMKRRCEFRLFSGEIYIQPSPCLCENLRLLPYALIWKSICIILLSHKPQTGKSFLIRSQQKITKRRSVFTDRYHVCTSPFLCRSYSSLLP